MWLYVILSLIVLIFVSGIRIVRPTQRGLIEFFGKYRKFSKRGFNWVIPIVERVIYVNITEQMVDAEKQEIITKDKLNAVVDAQVYFKVQEDEDSVKHSQYRVNNYQLQIVQLARTTLRNIIGTLTLNEANSERNKINSTLLETLSKETKNWGISIVRTELKQIDPPKDVQVTMNRVVIAENEKQAAIDFATSKETEADGERRASIKEAEGSKISKILEAEGQAEAIERVAEARAKEIELVNQSLQKNFKGQAEIYKKLETTERALSKGTKYIIDSKSNLVNVMSDSAGVTPIPTSKK